MERKEVELQPGAGQMVSTLAYKSGMSVTAAFRELIDNALDAGAKTILIRYNRGKHRLEIADDGRGASDASVIVTPYKHKDHATTQSGRYGIGGTGSMYFLTEARGSIDVRSITHEWDSEVSVDLNEIRAADKWKASIGRRPNVDRISTGTTITLNGCREINQQHVGSAYRELSLTFAPALRKNVKIVFETDNKPTVWQPYTPPAMTVKRSFDFEVGGHPVKGFCGLVKPGETNRVRGWAIEYGHRFVGLFSDPAEDRTADLGLIYSEVKLPRSWDNINDHKDGFVQPPTELWQRLAEACAPILDRADREGRSIELEASAKRAQELLDMAVGYDGPPIKGRRPNRGQKAGTVEPTGNGAPHRNFSAIQPGDKPATGKPHSLPRRVLINWSGGLETSYCVRPEAGRVRVMLSLDRPEMQLFRGEGAGEYLASWVMLAVASDWKCRPDHYRSLFPNSEAEDIPHLFDEMLSRIRGKAEEKAIA